MSIEFTRQSKTKSCLEMKILLLSLFCLISLISSTRASIAPSKRKSINNKL